MTLDVDVAVVHKAQVFMLQVCANVIPQQTKNEWRSRITLTVNFYLMLVQSVDQRQTLDFSALCLCGCVYCILVQSKYEKSLPNFQKVFIFSLISTKSSIEKHDKNTLRSN